MIFALPTQGNTIDKENQQREIRGILSIASTMFNLTFQQQWISAFINLLHTKQQITTFFKYYSEAYNYSISLDSMEIEDETSNVQIEMNSLDMLELQSTKQYQNRPKQEANSEILTHQISFLQYTNAIQSIVEQNPYIRLQSIHERLQQLAFEHTPSIQQTQNMLTSLKYRHKSLNKSSIDRNSMSNLQNRYKYCFEYNNLIRSRCKVFFIDACKVDMNLAPQYIWVKDNQSIKQRINDDHIEIMCCLSQKQPIIYDIRSRSKGDMLHDTIQIEIIANEIARIYYQQDIAVIINSQNIPISRQIKRIMIQHNWKLFILPPLAPPLNPASFLFKYINTLIRQTSNIHKIDQLYQFIGQVCHQITQSNIYFEQMKPYIIKGLTKSYF